MFKKQNNHTAIMHAVLTLFILLIAARWLVYSFRNPEKTQTQVFLYTYFGVE